MQQNSYQAGVVHICAEWWCSLSSTTAVAADANYGFCLFCRDPTLTKRELKEEKKPQGAIGNNRFAVLAGDCKSDESSEKGADGSDAVKHDERGLGSVPDVGAQNSMNMPWRTHNHFFLGGGGKLSLAIQK